MTTPLDALIAALRDAASYNPTAEAPPEAVLWCDPNREFQPLLPPLRDRMPELLTYGEIDVATRTGPAVWLRAAVAGALPEVASSDEATPIIYLPGIDRETLKSADDCPPLLQPLVWFTVAGALFGHINGKDWTLRGFLSSERGPLKLKIADDSATRSALAHAALRFCTKPVEELKDRRWDAGALNALLAPDLAADMLDWMDGSFDGQADPPRFAAFANIAAKELKFDPRKLSRQDAAGRLAKQEGRWAEVWSRFAAGTGHGGVVTLLEAEEPASLFDHSEAYPKLNVRGEDELRQALSRFKELSAAEAKARILELEKQHAWRRDTTWARRGHAPLAQALRYLVEVAKAKPLPAHNGSALAEAYMDAGAAVDGAATKALAEVTRAKDREALTDALRAVYLPWLDEGAAGLQELVRSGRVKLAEPGEMNASATTVLFVDGLRMDLALELRRVLSTEGVEAELGWQWSGFPTVTATCKALVSPVAVLLNGPSTTSDALPVTSEGKPATKHVLYKLLQREGWETDNSLLSDSRLWTEAGKFDELGHAVGAGLAGQIDACIRDVADRVIQLLRAGRSVQIVTDHGWLLMPGGLPTAALEPGLLEPQGKRSRCAMVKPRAATSYLQIPWCWNGDIFVATASGARCFFAAQEYAHGGVSPQECVLPVLSVSATGMRKTDVAEIKARWEGLRLRVEVLEGADLRSDLRLGSETSGPSLVKGGHALDDRGKTSFLVSDEYEGRAACLVVLNNDGRVLAHRLLTVGED